MVNHKTLEVWQRADTFARAVYPIVRSMPPREQPVLGNQLWRAALSVPCNIVEGYARSSERQLAYSLNVSIGSLGEAVYLLELASNLGVLQRETLERAIATAGPLNAQLGAFIRAIRNGRARHSRLTPSP